jgi:hypothetical protein
VINSIVSGLAERRARHELELDVLVKAISELARA